jgi:hypothetical protein
VAEERRFGNNYEVNAFSLLNILNIGLSRTKDDDEKEEEGDGSCFGYTNVETAAFIR